MALCALWYWKQNVLNVLPTPAPSDFRFYYYAAQHILHGESPYLTLDYIYPPLLASALVPIAGQALLASFRAAMRERVDEVVPTAFLPGASKGETPGSLEPLEPLD